MNQHIKVKVFIFCLSFFVCVGVSSASFVWTARSNVEVEFGLTSQVGDSVVSDPWAFETGYNGACVIGYDLLWGMGQTFKASNEGTLQSIELRVGNSGLGATGEFEVALYEVVLAEGTIVDYTRIASIFRLAEDYLYDTGWNVPVSSFDFSHFDIALSLAKTYAFAVLPTSSLDGRITVQSALDIYPEGNAWTIIIPEPATEVAVDIKPGSCPNPVNVKSKGVLPVAILGSADFDVHDIDVATIQLAGVDPNHSNYENVARPLIDANECECSTEEPDGYMDLTLKFNTQEIVGAIGPVADGDKLVLELTGLLHDDTPITGTDCIIIRAKGQK